MQLYIKEVFLPLTCLYNKLLHCTQYKTYALIYNQFCQLSGTCQLDSFLTDLTTTMEPTTTVELSLAPTTQALSTATPFLAHNITTTAQASPDTATTLAPDHILTTATPSLALNMTTPSTSQHATATTTSSPTNATITLTVSSGNNQVNFSQTSMAARLIRGDNKTIMEMTTTRSETLSETVQVNTITKGRENMPKKHTGRHDYNIYDSPKMIEMHSNGSQEIIIASL